MCLSCLVRRGVRVLDTEWHAFFDCPVASSPRALFTFAFPLAQFGSSDFLDTLVAITLQAGDDASLMGEFARLAAGVVSCRRGEFRALSPR